MIIATFIKRLIIAVWLCIVFVCMPASCETESREETLGRKYALEVEKQYKFVDDQAMTDRVQRIGKALADVANTVEVPAKYGSSDVVKFNYEFKIVEDKDANAFSLPGGKIYINSGLLDLVSSDSELAGVLAHEIAHAAHHHVTKLLNEQAKIDKYVAIIAILGILGKAKGSDIRNVMMGASMVRQGKISGYTMQAEQDADQTAISYMVKTQYDPLGMVDFMKKLDKMHDENPTAPLGIYQTHPAPFRRVASIYKALKKENIIVDIRKLRGIAYANPVECTPGSGKYDVMICDKVFYSPTSLDSASSSKKRADELSKAINSLLDSGLKPQDIAIDDATGCLVAKGKVLLRIEQGDLNSASENSRILLTRARRALVRATWADWLMNTCSAYADEDPTEIK
ncbi:MAG: M48 family metalloprotease [Armatimonadetes bacterium]|nr:M48 family metalloprotease [Armatimonadota bacterium]